MQKLSANSQFPAVSVDLVLLTVIDNMLQVALAPRESEYLKGELALIGATVDRSIDPDLEATVARILLGRGGLSNIFVEQLYTFGSETRDERGWSISISYYGLIPKTKLQATKKHLSYFPVDALPTLPFDHRQIVDAAVGRVRGKGGYSTIPARLLNKEFTMPQMRDIYSAVLGQNLSMPSFRRKVESLRIVRETNKKTTDGPGDRPAKLYTLASGIVNFDRSL